MRIVHIPGSSLPVVHSFGGASERRALEIAREQARRGHEVLVYSCSVKKEILRVGEVTIRCLACKSSPPLRDLEFQMRVVADLKQNRTTTDVLHFHGSPEGAFLSKPMRSKKFLSYDFFYFRRVHRTPFYPLYRRMLDQFDLLFPVSEYCQKESLAYWHLDSWKCPVVYNGVNVEQFFPDSHLGEKERAKLGITQRVVLYVGRVCLQKGTDVLLECYRKLSAMREDVQLVVVGPIGRFGSQSDAEHWGERIKQCGGLYLGPVEEGRLAAIYNMANVFVMPTREFEMFGMAALEAQACAKPVIASDHGGLREVVPEKCGGRFPVGNAVAMAERIELLLDDQDRYASCSANALQNSAQYSWSSICDRLSTLYTMGGRKERCT